MANMVGPPTLSKISQLTRIMSSTLTIEPKSNPYDWLPFKKTQSHNILQTDVNDIGSKILYTTVDVNEFAHEMKTKEVLLY